MTLDNSKSRSPHEQLCFSFISELEDTEMTLDGMLGDNFPITGYIPSDDGYKELYEKLLDRLVHKEVVCQLLHNRNIVLAAEIKRLNTHG